VLGFYNRVENSLALLPDSVNSGLRYRNLDGYMDSQGCETQVKFTFGKFTLFAGYTYTEARQHYASLTGRFPLTPTHSLKGDLLFIAQGKWRIVADYEIKSGQVLGSGRVARGYASGGLVVERTIGPVRLYFNIENVLDVRQSRFESLRSGPNDTPQFTEVWAPLEGIVLNGGVIVRL
jgi:iron complex outermembrane receptor protein